MTDFTIHTQGTAPAESQPMLENLQKAIGFVPALYGVLAEAPKALEAYEVLGACRTMDIIEKVERFVISFNVATRISEQLSLKSSKAFA